MGCLGGGGWGVGGVGGGGVGCGETFTPMTTPGAASSENSASRHGFQIVANAGLGLSALCSDTICKSASASLAPARHTAARHDLTMSLKPEKKETKYFAAPPIGSPNVHFSTSTECEQELEDPRWPHNPEPKSGS